MIGSIYRTDAEPDALLWWSDRAQETAAKAAGGYGRKHRQQKTEETEIVTVLTHTYYRVKYLQERKEKPDFDEIRGGDREIYNLCFEGAQSNQPSSDPRPQKKFLFFSYTLREGGACPGLESRGGVRASNMQCKPKYPKPACLLCLRIASLPEQSAGRLLVLLSVPKSRTMPASS